ncbi:MAG: hypothetical protein J3K34DRAFT_520510 [Monoraphidium minutum]|nr:MAG: hypothetical protein J3K34DRAFT_520510 [Monoraphidium minutum]
MLSATVTFPSSMRAAACPRPAGPLAARAARPARVCRASSSAEADTQLQARINAWRSNGSESHGNGAGAAPAAGHEPPAAQERAPRRVRDPEMQAQAAVNDGLINNQFAEALQAALSRSGGEKALIDAASRSMDEERGSPLKPVEEMLVTALHTSRHTMQRLIQRQSELEAEIAKEQKQAARLEWLLNRTRADYSYFAAVDKMQNGE